MDNLLDNNKFYDQLASQYDSMISFEKSVNNKRNLLRDFIRPNTKSAADIGCGTGADSISLALNGLNISAFDPSTEMLKHAEVNSKNFKVKIDFQNHSADKIPELFNNSFDLIVSLGNTFANIPRENFSDSIKKCSEILKPEGSILIQVLNYKKILVEKKRIVNITKGGEKYFIRFYDFLEESLVFNLLQFDAKLPLEGLITSTKIFPYVAEDFISALKNSGINNINLYSDLKRNEYLELYSPNLIILATKS
jgi:ubiquinone/menaquinone biosynthesis C-methylase UbiE